MLTPPDNQLLFDLNNWVEQLKHDTTNVPLRTKILQTQVDMTAKQLGVSKTEAASAVRTYTAGYAYSKGIDPKELLEALTIEEQRIINYSKDNPTLYGVDLVTANQIAGYLGIGSGVVLTISLTLFTIALFTVGPEAAAAIAAGEGVVATLGAALGTPILAAGGFAFLISQFLGHLSSGIPMMTKQMIDNGSIGPGLRITAFKQAQEVAGKISGHLAPGPFSETQFLGYAASLEQAGILGISNPGKAQSQPYNRENLADLVLYVYGNSAGKGVKLTVTKLIPLIAPNLIMKTGQAVPIGIPSSASASTGASGGSSSSVSVKIFTGVVANGALGATVTFTERPDDLITSVGELKDAAKNNLTAFVQSLPGQFYYEIAIVSSVKTKGGFTQQGSAVKVQVGTYHNGLPKYKTIYNKFAVMRIGVIDGNGKSVKLREIVLGPVDATSFQPTSVQLQDISTAITPELFTSDVANISSIVTTQPVTVQPPPAAAPSPAPVVYQPTPAPSPAGGTATPVSTPVAVTAPVQQPATPPPAPTPAPVDPRIAKAKATTNLSDFYTAMGSSLPALSTRAALYQSYGLGQASLYTGTAEQNTKLLAYLKTTI